MNFPENFKDKHILYVCVVTAQNTINVLPYEFFEGQVCKPYLALLCSDHALKNWYERLNDFSDFPSYPIMYAEGDSPLLNAHNIENELHAKIQEFFSIPVQNRIIILNYGGGQKHLTPALFKLIEKLQAATKFLVYPDKFKDKFYWDELDINNEPVNRETLDITIHVPLLKILGLFTLNDPKPKNTLFSRFNRLQQGITSLEQLPDLYVEEEYTNFLFSTREGLDIDFSQILKRYEVDSEFKQQLNLLLIAKLKSSITNPDIEVNLSGGQINVASKNLLQSITLLNVCSKLLTLEKKELLSPSFYHQLNNSTRTFNITSPKWKKAIFQRLNEDIKGQGLSIHKKTIENLFSSYNNSVVQITSHAQYFEAIVAKKLLEWISSNEEKLLEVHWSYSFYDKSEQLVEFDFVIFTRKGNIIVLECKSFDFDRKDLLAAYYKCQQYGGVYNQYHVVVPPLPTDSLLKDKMFNVLKKIKTETSRQPRIKVLMYDAIETNEFREGDLVLPSLSSYLQEVSNKL